MYLISVDINWPVIIIVGIAVIVLLVWINKRNQKDEKDMEDTMNQVEKKPMDHDSDNDTKS